MADLTDLLVDRAQLDREMLAGILLPYIGIDASRREVVPGEKWRALNPQGKIVAVLLGRKAMCSMPEVSLDVEGMRSAEIGAATALKGGTVRSALSRLKDQGIVTQDERGGYFVPTASVPRAGDFISRRSR